MNNIINNDLEFIYDPDTAGMMLVKCRCNSETVEVPAIFCGKPVTVIDSYCFIDVIDKSTKDKVIFTPESDNDTLKKIILPESLLEIRYCAFMHCTALESVSIPENVQYIGPSAFLNCSALSSIKFPDRCRMILRGVCRNCISLEKADISGAYEIEYGAFMGCTSLSILKTGKNLKKIGAMAFMDCTSLTDINIPENIAQIEMRAFLNSGISNHDIPESVY